MNASARDGPTSAPVKIRNTVSMCGGAASILETHDCAAQCTTAVSSARAATKKLKSRVVHGSQSSMGTDLGSRACSRIHD